MKTLLLLSVLLMTACITTPQHNVPPQYLMHRSMADSQSLILAHCANKGMVVKSQTPNTVECDLELPPNQTFWVQLATMGGAHATSPHAVFNVIFIPQGANTLIVWHVSLRNQTDLGQWLERPIEDDRINTSYITALRQEDTQ